MLAERSTMTPRERVRAALNHREPDRVPLDMGSMHTSIETYAYGPLKQYLGLLPDRPIRTFTRDHVEPDDELLALFGIDTRYLRVGTPDGWRLQIEPDNSFLDEFGSRWQKPSGSLYFDPVGYPLADATVAELEARPWPDPHDPGRTRGLRERAQRLYETTDYALCLDTVGFGIFESLLAAAGPAEFPLRPHRRARIRFRADEQGHGFQTRPLWGPTSSRGRVHRRRLRLRRSRHPASAYGLAQGVPRTNQTPPGPALAFDQGSDEGEVVYAYAAAASGRSSRTLSNWGWIFSTPCNPWLPGWTRRN